jgi:hypothetical protein
MASVSTAEVAVVNYTIPLDLVNTSGDVSVLVLWTRLHDERECCRSRVCDLSVDKIQWQKRILYAFFWVIPRRLNFLCRRFGTLSVSSSCAGRYISQAQSFFTPTCPWRWNRQCSEISAYKIQMSGNYPEESVQRSERDESLKSTKRSCRSSFFVRSVDKTPWQKRIFLLQFLCSFCGQDAFTKENFLLQFLCSFCGQDALTKENLFASVSVFVLWTRLHSEKESCRSSLPPRSETPPTQPHLSLHLPRYPLGCCIDDGVGIFLSKMLPLLSSSKNTTWFNTLHILLIFSDKTLRIKTASHNK